MCLDAARNVPANRQKGYAYKVVRPIAGENDLFEGKWPRFRIGSGGTSDATKYTVRNCVTWKLGRMYRVKHNREVKVFGTHVKVFGTPVSYPALVHLYKTLTRAWANQHCEEVVLVCWYTSGKHEDGVSITAKRVTPVLVLRSYQEVTSFEMMRKHSGMKEALRSFLNYREKNPCQDA